MDAEGAGGDAGWSHCLCVQDGQHGRWSDWLFHSGPMICGSNAPRLMVNNLLQPDANPLAFLEGRRGTFIDVCLTHASHPSYGN